MKRKIAVMVGSKNDFLQCGEGLHLLQRAVEASEVEFIGVFVNSIHGNTQYTLLLLQKLANEGVDAIVVGAGWANHLTGTADAFLRYGLRNIHTVVIGVAFEDNVCPTHTTTAIASIVDVPKTQVVFNNFVGRDGFKRACQFAVSGALPDITLPPPRDTLTLTLEQALAKAMASAG